MAKNNGKRMPAFRRNTHNRMSMALIAVAVIVMTIIVGYSVYNMKIELNENKEKIESLNKNIAKEEKLSFKMAVISSEFTKQELIGHASAEMLRYYQDAPLDDLRKIADAI